MSKKSDAEEEAALIAKEQAEEEAALIAREEEEAALIAEEEEEDRRYALEATQEDSRLDEYPDWNPKTHSIVWDIQHGYVLIPYEKERPSSRRPK